MSALGMEKNGNPLLQYMRQEKLPHFFCPGCGCGQVVNAFLRAAEQLKLDLGAMVGIGGVGCTARIPVYINMDCLHGVHGRTLPWATGIKLVKPDTKVVVFAGDGDAMSIGGNHFIHAARRNLDVTFIVVNNFNFAMTGGQVAPMTPDGSVTMTTPYGSSEPPFDMCALAVTAGATYVSRTLTSNPAQMTTYIKAALNHKGFSVVEILSQCPTHFGRYALGSGSPKNLVEWIKNRTIPLSAADKLPPEETAGKYRLGEFINIERPVFRGSTLYISDDACETCDTCGEKEEAKS
ncbi:MAG: thiamine pyrophosphate-dependent enzyme [Synergistaceae bacterium]|nr:thiamine pyrophosphate-dependent enzyme [Synergistaceae bacterium]